MGTHRNFINEKKACPGKLVEKTRGAKLKIKEKKNTGLTARLEQLKYEP